MYMVVLAARLMQFVVVVMVRLVAMAVNGSKCVADGLDSD